MKSIKIFTISLAILLFFLGIGYYIWKNKHSDLSAGDNLAYLKIVKQKNKAREDLGKNDWPKSKIEELDDLGKQWYLNNISEEGLFVYLQTAEGEEKRNKNNIIRQLLACRNVAQFCNEGDERFCKLHQQNLRALIKKYKADETDDGIVGYIIGYKGTSSLGANALFLRVLVESKYFDEYADDAKIIFNGITSLQRKDGSFDIYAVKPAQIKNPDRRERFYSGEAILALMEYYNKTGDKNIYEVARRARDYYDKKYIQDIENNFHPAYVPWQILANYEFYKIDNNEHYLNNIFLLADQLLKLQDQKKDLGQYLNLAQPGKEHSSSTGIFSEALAVAYGLAEENNEIERSNKYKTALLLAIDNLTNLQFCNQYSQIDDIKNNNLDKVCGGIVINKKYPISRVDNLAHTLDFLGQLKNIKN